MIFAQNDIFRMVVSLQEYLLMLSCEVVISFVDFSCILDSGCG